MELTLDLSAPERKSCKKFELIHITSKDPLEQFKAWFTDSLSSEARYDANVAALATCTKQGVPSVRYVLIQRVDDSGFQFFTNYCSRKAKELEENPMASIAFYWEPLNRQIRIEGKVSRLPESMNTTYFASWPKKYQLRTMVSPTGEVVPNRSNLDEEFQNLEKKFTDVDKIPKPDNWGGYVLTPTAYEFWQGQSDRPDDCIRFRRQSAGKDWICEQITP